MTGDLQNGYNQTEIVGNFHGAGHAIRRSLIQKVGYLDEDCFFGGEELEFSMRALVAGMNTIYTPEIEVKHYNLERSGSHLIKRRIYWARNYAMVLFRYLPFMTASLFSGRLLLSYITSGISTIKLAVIFLPPAMLIGCIMGLLSRNPLDTAGVAFYSLASTRPEIGNVSVYSKILRHLRKINIRI